MIAERKANFQRLGHQVRIAGIYRNFAIPKFVFVSSTINKLTRSDFDECIGSIFMKFGVEVKNGECSPNPKFNVVRDGFYAHPTAKPLTSIDTSFDKYDKIRCRSQQWRP